MDKLAVFFDFDNTITTFDTLDDLILRYSINDKWKSLEERWKAGKIGSKECLKGQLEGIRITRKELDRYLKSVTIDPRFKKLLKMLRSKKIKTFVLSDDFDYVIKNVFKNNGIKNLKIYSNKLTFGGDRLIPHFTFTDKNCTICAHCKKNNLLANVSDKFFKVYVGDGLSDVCPSKSTDLIFAKKTLWRHLKKGGVYSVPYKRMNDIYNYFKEKLI